MLNELPETARGKIIVESSSGNLGFALGSFCKEIGLNFICLVDSSIASAKLKKLEVAGIAYEIVTVRNGLDLRSSRIQRAQEMMDSGKYYWMNQYDNLSGVKAHRVTTGPEIWEQTQHAVSTVVCAMGSGGTICGISQFMKSKNVNIRICGVEPFGSTIFGSIDAPYINVGAGLVGKPGNLLHSKAIIDEALTITDQESIECAEKMYHEYGLRVGVTSGMAYAGVLKLAEQTTDETFVMIAPDGRDAYGEYLGE
jgi:cysteine synthase